MLKKLAPVLALLLMVVFMPAAAERYPDKPIRIINPFPGGSTDVFARIVARRLQLGLEQPVVVDGRAGAGGTIGVSTVAKSAADGYTLLVTSGSTQVVQPVVRKAIPYAADTDFTPIASTGLTPQLIVVHPSLPVTNLRELIDYAKANPEALSYSSSGSGTALHMAGEVFANAAGVKIQHVPYKTAAQAVTDLLGGQVKLMFDSAPNSAPHIRSGKLRAIAVMGAERAKALPDVKTTTELGFPSMRFYNFLGIYAPAATPPEVIERLTSVLRPGLVDAEANAFYESAAMPPTPLFGAEFARTERAQRQELSELVKKIGFELLD